MINLGDVYTRGLWKHFPASINSKIFKKVVSYNSKITAAMKIVDKIEIILCYQCIRNNVFGLKDVH